LQLSSSSFGTTGKILASVTVKNTGKVAGKEVVQMYVRDLIGSITRPVKELKGFELIELLPNEAKKVDFIIDQNTIQYFTANSRWEAEAGDFNVFIGGSSTATLEASFHYNN